MDFGRESEANYAIDYLSKKYYQEFVQPWEATWKKGENPKVMTEKEIAEAEEEIRATTATVNMRVSNAIGEIRSSDLNRNSKISAIDRKGIGDERGNSDVYRSSKISGTD